jgi:hypothetical protein
VDLDAEHRTLVSLVESFRPALEDLFRRFSKEHDVVFHVFSSIKKLMEEMMGRGILLWLLGVPIPVIILLWLFFGR